MSTTLPQTARLGIYLVTSAVLSWVVVFEVIGTPRTVSGENPVANETVTVWTPSLEAVVPIVGMIVVAGLWTGWRIARDSA